MNGAEYFFESVSITSYDSIDQNIFIFLTSQKVMKTTETYISWPCRLKIGAKSKKGILQHTLN